MTGGALSCLPTLVSTLKGSEQNIKTKEDFPTEDDQEESHHTNEYVYDDDFKWFEDMDVGFIVVDKESTPPRPFETRDSNQSSEDGKQTASATGSGSLKADQRRKLGHRRVGQHGEVTYKKIHTSEIMYSIQLGISHAIGGLAPKPERDILMQDFKTIESMDHHFEGSRQTPNAHRYSDFGFESFAPIAFRYFRNYFGIDPHDFVLSLCNQPLRELSNAGASGSIFYVSADDEFIIKTVQYKEGEFLKKLLPGYNMNLNQNPRTLLPKFFGFYSYICNSRTMRMVVMNNLLPSSIKLHEKYDLKGSTYKRKASDVERSKQAPTFKDLDFMELHPDGILLEPETYAALIKTIQRDCRVLESFKIMDYSLLVAIHNLDLAAKEEIERDHNNLAEDERNATENAGTIRITKPNPNASTNRRRLVAHSTTLESIQMEVDADLVTENIPSGGVPARNTKGERLLLFLGIIDILQSYRLEKKLEHTLKALIHDGDTVSVHRPDFYSQRFENFLANQVFRKISSS
ncbi:phosphatidylinositol 4-phosphate 5-kinase type-1 alpha-like isoform X2 [Daphnia carinata]|uniref:phosphatidylinositol 4-phosphate 5-kinase type-1 alpha-like isoform X2 n=1 Tax=Daphnia carinata TaxID=120202 RepID=UPI0028690EA2|nr:phosphatidylinositol 4-phosphate 5-kinase type-1 alpha-like isoform X2 [Daphnia carinata]